MTEGLVIVKLAIVCMAGQGMCMWKLCIFRLGALNGGTKINDERKVEGGGNSYASCVAPLDFTNLCPFLSG